MIVAYELVVRMLVVVAVLLEEADESIINFPVTGSNVTGEVLF